VEKKDDKLIINNLNNFVEITNIQMSDYIDSSTSVNTLDKDKTLIEVLKNSDQRNEMFELEINLVFYCITQTLIFAFIGIGFFVWSYKKH
jgi:hypothetical protein